MALYYANQNFLNTTYALDIAIENHLKGLLFPEEIDLARIIYSSNNFAFRKRAEIQENNNLNLPFLNYKLLDFDFKQQTWWHNEAYAEGVYIREIDSKIKISPVGLVYECSLWMHKAVDLRYAFTELRFDADSKTTIQASIDIGGETILFPGQLGYTNLDYDPEYEEADWLEKNKIHSITLDFEVITWIMKTNTNICVPTQIVFDFLSQHGIDNSTSHEENMEYFLDYLDEEVKDSPYIGTGGIGTTGEAITSIT